MENYHKLSDHYVVTKFHFVTSRPEALGHRCQSPRIDNYKRNEEKVVVIRRGE